LIPIIPENHFLGNALGLVASDNWPNQNDRKKIK